MCIYIYIYIYIYTHTHTYIYICRERVKKRMGDKKLLFFLPSHFIYRGSLSSFTSAKNKKINFSFLCIWLGRRDYTLSFLFLAIFSYKIISDAKLIHLLKNTRNFHQFGIPAHWPSGERRRFNPRSRHTKDFKNGTWYLLAWHSAI